EQGLPRRNPASGGGRRPIFLSWKVLLPSALLLFAVALLPVMLPHRAPVARLTYTELVRAIDAGRVAHIEIEPGHGVRGRWRTSATGYDFEVLYTVDDPGPLLQHAERGGVVVAFRPAGASQAYRGWI